MERERQMAEVLVLVDQHDGEIRRSTLELLTAARALGEPSAVVVGPGGVAAKLADGLREHGAVKIYVAETDSADFLSPQVAVLAGLVATANPAAVLIAGTADGRESAGRLAVRTGAGLLADAVGVAAGPLTTTHSVFGGAYIAQATANTEHPVITVRPGSIEVTAAGAGVAEPVTEPVTVPSSGRSATVTGREPLVAGD